MAARPSFSLDRSNAGRRRPDLHPARRDAAGRSSWPPPASGCCRPMRSSTRLERQFELLASSARDVPERQRTLRGAIAWSYDLLDAPEPAPPRPAGLLQSAAAISRRAEQVCGPADELGRRRLRRDRRAGRPEPHPPVRGRRRDPVHDARRRSARSPSSGSRRAARPTRSGGATPRRSSIWPRPRRPSCPAPTSGAGSSGSSGSTTTCARRSAWAIDTPEPADRARARLPALAVLAEARPPRRRPAAGSTTSRPGRGPRTTRSAYAQLLEALGGIAYWQGDFVGGRSRRTRVPLDIWRELGDRSEIANALYNLAFTYNIDSNATAARRRLRHEPTAGRCSTRAWRSTARSTTSAGSATSCGRWAAPTCSPSDRRGRSPIFDEARARVQGRRRPDDGGLGAPHDRASSTSMLEDFAGRRGRLPPRAPPLRRRRRHHRPGARSSTTSRRWPWRRATRSAASACGRPPAGSRRRSGPGWSRPRSTRRAAGLARPRARRRDPRAPRRARGRGSLRCGPSRRRSPTPSTATSRTAGERAARHAGATAELARQDRRDALRPGPDSCAATPVPAPARTGGVDWASMAAETTPAREKTGDPEEPGPARPRDEGDAPLPRPRHRRAVLRPAHLHRLPDVLLGARAGRDLPPRRRRRDRPAQAAEADPGRHRVGPRLDDRAHRVHVRDQRRLADPVAPARPPSGRRRVRPAEPALRHVQGRLDDAADVAGRGGSGAARALRGPDRGLARAVRRPASRPGSPARTPGSSSRTRPGRTW